LLNELLTYLTVDNGVAQSLAVDVATTLFQALISSRLDYCNAVLHGITDSVECS